MIAPRPPVNYDARWAAEIKQVFDVLAQQAHLRNRDIEVGDGRVIITSPDGSKFALVVSNTGALSTVPV